MRDKQAGVEFVIVSVKEAKQWYCILICYKHSNLYTVAFLLLTEKLVII